MDNSLVEEGETTSSNDVADDMADDVADDVEEGETPTAEEEADMTREDGDESSGTWGGDTGETNRSSDSGSDRAFVAVLEAELTAAASAAAEEHPEEEDDAPEVPEASSDDVVDDVASSAAVATLEAELDAAVEAELDAAVLSRLELEGRLSGLEVALQMSMQAKNWAKCQLLQEEMDTLRKQCASSAFSGQEAVEEAAEETPTGGALPVLGVDTPVADKEMQGRDGTRGVEAVVAESIPAVSQKAAAPSGAKPSWGDWRKDGAAMQEGSAKKRAKPKVKTLFPPMDAEGMPSPTVA